MRRVSNLIGQEHIEREDQARHRLIDAMLSYACARIADPPAIETTLLYAEERAELFALLPGSDSYEFLVEHPEIQKFCKKHKMQIWDESYSSGLPVKLQSTIIFPSPVPVK